MTTVSNDQTANTVNLSEASRRQFLQKMLGLACVTGSASMLSSCALKSADNFVKTKSEPVNSRVLFNEGQMATLFAIGDAILPRTDTPSASEVNCHHFVQHQLLACHARDEQQACVEIVAQIDKSSVDKLNKPFALLIPAQQQALLTQLEKGQGFTDQQQGQFSLLKALIIFGYFTSEAGATQALNYQAVPGGFKGSIPCDENTKSWGSIDYY
ncbi:gluconate 2-dehydrogenase subunit 3 family protein [Paraglaciecola aquimarina]|uniref:Gluconate 2-dehydrogenase subunit 3 family protein n=1 Tax=Paraglaciecola algarum TaxID=3050085 RepID=A0ABS9D3H8_9ALTE|nr:gluconate 2-dehydrogenase subunit 3 family protein [Paraglaciecola sp. G1-23]MCF2947480.1 gluconate 2-dehydrogenase subunit 3 family protein [Paraglaciecola sp. G1-23]